MCIARHAIPIFWWRIFPALTIYDFSRTTFYFGRNGNNAYL
jgi:hypothetical protein